MDRTRVLLIGGRLPFTLDLGRLLHADGLEVFALDTEKCNLCRYSRAIKKSYLTPSPLQGTEGFIEKVIEVTEKEKIDLLIPTFEEGLLLSLHRELFPPHCELFCSSFEQQLRLHNKYALISRLSELGLPVPETRLITDPHQISTLDFEEDYVLKPCYSRASKHVIRVNPKDVLPTIKASSSVPWIAQKWIEGKRYCSFSVCRQGKVLAHTLYPVRFAIDGTSCLHFEAIEHKEIEEWVKKFVASEKYTGQIAFDFIESKEDKHLYSIDCNPRTTSGIHLFSKKEKISLAYLGKTDQTIYPKPGTRRQIFLAMCLFGWKHSASPGGIGPFLRKLFTTKDVIYNRSDLRPVLICPWLLAVYWRKLRRLRLSLPDYATHDFEWNGIPQELMKEEERDILVEREEAFVPILIKK